MLLAVQIAIIAPIVDQIIVIIIQRIVAAGFVGGLLGCWRFCVVGHVQVPFIFALAVAIVRGHLFVG